MELTERDDHDQVLAEWEQTLSPGDLDRLRAGGYRLTSDGV